MGQVAKGTTASFALGPHGASVCGRTEHALPGVEVVGGVWALIAVGFAPAVGVFSCVGEGADGVALSFVPAGGVGVDEIGDFGASGTVFGLVDGCADGVCEAFGGVCGVFGGRIVPFAPVGVVFGGVAVGLVPAGGVGVDEIGVFGALGTVFGGVCGGADGVCGAFGGVCGAVVLVFGVFGSAAAACGAAAGETGAKRSASDGAGGADVDEATEEGAAERRLC